MMDKHAVAKIAILLIALTANTANADYDVVTYCKLVPFGTRFPSLRNCQTYYTCNANGGYTEQNCMLGESFDKDAQTCKPSSMVNCYYGVEDPCVQTSGATFATNPKNCNGYVYCVDKTQKGTGVCPTGQIFNGTQCINGQCTNDLGPNAIVDLGSPCEIMKSGAYFGDFTECNAWHKCSNGIMKNGTCNADLVFAARRAMCLADDGKMCSRIENPSVAPSEPCDKNAVNTVKGDKNVCSVYYRCDGNVWNKQTCPNNLYFDVNKNQCLARQVATPAKGCNRCQYATTNWVNAVDPDCEDYLQCIDGNKASEGTCGDGNYFDELKQACIKEDSKGLLTYSQNNGACNKEDPPKEDPPKEDPPKEDPPKEDPPKEDPPKEDPPKEDPPKEDPPKEDPPKEDPPKEDPPKEDPPKEDPPKEDPPKEDPPKEDPPKEDPTKKTL